MQSILTPTEHSHFYAYVWFHCKDQLINCLKNGLKICLPCEYLDENMCYYISSNSIYDFLQTKRYTLMHSKSINIILENKITTRKKMVMFLNNDYYITLVKLSNVLIFFFKVAYHNQQCLGLVSNILKYR